MEATVVTGDQACLRSPEAVARRVVVSRPSSTMYQMMLVYDAMPGRGAATAQDPSLPVTEPEMVEPVNERLVGDGDAEISRDGEIRRSDPVQKHHLADKKTIQM